MKCNVKLAWLAISIRDLLKLWRNRGAGVEKDGRWGGGKYVLEHKFFVGVMCWERGGSGDVVKKLEKKFGKSLDWKDFL